MDEIIKTDYMVSFDGIKYELVKIEYFYRNEIECAYITKIISSLTQLYFEFPGGYCLTDKTSLFNRDSHYISKEQYEMAYNIAVCISESIKAYERLIYNNGTSKYDNQNYAIMGYETNARGTKYYQRKGNNWYEIGDNYDDIVFSFYPHLKVETERDEQPIFSESLEGELLIRLLKNGTHSFFMLLSVMYQR